MRSFDYSKLADKVWDTNILNFVAKIHEYKSRQDLFIRQKAVFNAERDKFCKKYIEDSIAASEAPDMEGGISENYFAY